MEKSKVDGNVSASDHISHGFASSTTENKTNLQNPRDAEVSTVSSERVHSAQQTSIRSNFSSDSGQPFNGKRKDPDTSVMTGANHGNPTTKIPHHNKLLKTDSASSKESGEVVQLSSVDSTDLMPSQSSNDYLVEKKPSLNQSNDSKTVSRLRESSVTTKSDSIVANMRSSRHFNFDLNEGMEENGAESNSSIRASSLVSEPISVVAKFGVPIGLPRKPLQFGGELGWKRSGTASAFRPTSVKNPKRDWIDLNVAASMDLDSPTDETSLDFTSKQTERFSLDLNCQSEEEENHHKPGASSFNLNNNPMTEDTHNYQHSEGRPRKSVVADTATCSGGNVNQPILDMRRPPYWVDLSSMRGFGHVPSQPFLVAAPTAEQVQMVVPSGFYIGKVNNLPPTFYPPSVFPHISNQHGAAAMPQISGSVLAAYPGAVNFLEGSQGPNSHAYANIRPTFIPNGSVPLMENGSRGGVTNAELMIPVRNGLFEARQKPVEHAALPASQINHRQMASWN